MGAEHLKEAPAASAADRSPLKQLLSQACYLLSIVIIININRTKTQLHGAGLSQVHGTLPRLHSCGGLRATYGT